MSPASACGRGERPRAILPGLTRSSLRLDLMNTSLAVLATVVSTVAARSADDRDVPPRRLSEADRVALLARPRGSGLGRRHRDRRAGSLASRRARRRAGARQPPDRLASRSRSDAVAGRARRDRQTRVPGGRGYRQDRLPCAHRRGPWHPARAADDERTAGRIAVVGIGPRGRLTRIVAPLLGSPLAYVSMQAGLETADGQLTRGELAQAWSALGERL